MRTHTSSTATPATPLFPFLAVLMCALGALVVLLLAITHIARSQAEQRDAHRSDAETHAATTSPRSQPPASERPSSTPYERGVGARSPAAREHAERPPTPDLRRARADLLAAVARSRPLVDSLARAVEQAETNLAAADADARRHEADRRARDQARRRLHNVEHEIASLDAQRRRLADETATLQAELQQRTDAHARAANQYTVLPYDGPNGTIRRPIYIECTRAGIILQPEGIHFGQDDLPNLTGPGNILAAAIQARIQFERSRRSDGSERGSPGANDPEGDNPEGDNPGADSPQGHSPGADSPGADSPGADNSDNSGTGVSPVSADPYPLLIVRPDGIEAFYVARRALEPLGLRFGYELVEQELALDYRSGAAAADEAQLADLIDHLLAAIARAKDSRRASFVATAAAEQREAEQRSELQASPRPRVAPAPVPASTDDSRGAIPLPLTPAAADVAVPRTIVLDCTASEALLWPDRIAVAIDANRDATRAAAELRDHLARHIETWPAPPRGVRWQPRLFFHVAPDGLANYYRLRRALAAAGFDSEFRIRPTRLPGPPPIGAFRREGARQ